MNLKECKEIQDDRFSRLEKRVDTVEKVQSLLKEQNIKTQIYIGIATVVANAVAVAFIVGLVRQAIGG